MAGGCSEKSGQRAKPAGSKPDKPYSAEITPEIENLWKYTTMHTPPAKNGHIISGSFSFYN